MEKRDTIREERAVCVTLLRQAVVVGDVDGGRLEGGDLGGQFVRRGTVLIRALGVYGKLPDQDALLMLG